MKRLFLFLILIISFLSPKAQTIDATNHTVTISTAQEYVNFACWYGYTDKYKSIDQTTPSQTNYAKIIVKLDADIYLDDPSLVIPEGCQGKNHTIHSFRGEFDGQNHAVYGLDSCMFDYFVNKANIHNLIIREADIKPHGSSNYIGLIGEVRYGALQSSTGVTIDHVIVEKSNILTENSSTCVGAIVGKIDKKNTNHFSDDHPENKVPNIKLKDCFVKDVKIHTKNHSLTNDTIVGGFIGLIETNWEASHYITNQLQYKYLERCSINNIEFIHEDAYEDEIANFEEKHHFFGNKENTYDQASSRLRYCYYSHFKSKVDGENHYRVGAQSWSDIQTAYPDIVAGRTEIPAYDLTMYIYNLLIGEMGGLKIEENTKDYYGIYRDYDGTDYRQGQILLLLQDSVQNGVLTIRNKAFLPQDMTNDNFYSKNDVITDIIIADKGSLIDNRGEEYAYKKATMLKDLTVGQWNFVGSTVQKNNTGEVFNECQTAIVEQDGEYVYQQTFNDVAVLPYNSLTNDWGEYLLASDNMEKGKGYFVWLFNALQQGETDNSKKVLNNNETAVMKVESNFYTDDNITITDQRGGNAAGSGETTGYWLYLSNPYPATINVKQFLSDNSNESIQGNVVYVYRNNTWNCLVEGDENEIYHSEGFAVGYSEIGTTNLTIKNPKQYGFVENKSSNDSQLMRFVSKANDSEKKAYANISSKAGNGFDIMDAYVMLSTNRTDFVEPYFMVDEHLVLKNSFKNLPYVCDINFHASQISNTEFTVENVPNDIEVSIIDIENDNTETVISDGTVFNFVAQVGENEGRYKIKFDKKNISINDVANQDNTIIINNDNNKLKVSGNNLQSISITNVLGQNLINEKINAAYYNKTLDLQKGTYIVKVKSANGINTSKIIIK